MSQRARGYQGHRGASEFRWGDFLGERSRIFNAAKALTSKRGHRA